MTRENVTVSSFLAQPEAYDPRPELVDRIETHISEVFLCGPLVYKMKKPVRFDFLDFSTLDARRKACCEEVRLNRRLAPDVYLGIAPVLRDSHGNFGIGDVREPSDLPLPADQDRAGGRPQPTVVEWLVVMRRLPE